MSRQPPRPDSGLYPDWKTWANALLRYLSLVEEESALSAGTQVKTYASTDVPSAEQAGQIIYQTDTLKMSASFNDVWNDFAFLSVQNIWTARQDIDTGDTSFQAGLQVYSTDASANSGPYIIIDRRSPSPAVSDGLGGLLWRGRNDAGETTDFAFIFGSILQVTDGAEFGHLIFNILNNGIAVNNFSIGNGVRIGVPTSGFLGAGKLNCAGEYYVNGLQVVRARFTGWSVDTGTAKRTANATYSGTAEAGYTQATIQTLMDAVRDLSQTVKALKDDLHATAGHGLIGT